MAAELPPLPLAARVVLEAALLSVIVWAGLWGMVGPIVLACVLVGWWHHWTSWRRWGVPFMGRALGATAALVFLVVVAVVFLGMARS